MPRRVLPRSSALHVVGVPVLEGDRAAVERRTRRVAAVLKALGAGHGVLPHEKAILGPGFAVAPPPGVPREIHHRSPAVHALGVPEVVQRAQLPPHHVPRLRHAGAVPGGHPVWRRHKLGGAAVVQASRRLAVRPIFHRLDAVGPPVVATHAELGQRLLRPGRQQRRLELVADPRHEVGHPGVQRAPRVAEGQVLSRRRSAGPHWTRGAVGAAGAPRRGAVRFCDCAAFPL